MVAALGSREEEPVARRPPLHVLQHRVGREPATRRVHRIHRRPADLDPLPRRDVEDVQVEARDHRIPGQCITIGVQHRTGILRLQKTEFSCSRERAESISESKKNSLY